MLAVDELGLKFSADSLRVDFPAKKGPYHVVRLDRDPRGLIVSFLWDDDVERLRDADPKLLPTKSKPKPGHEHELTSSTARIRKFLELYGEADSLFWSLDPMTRQR